VAHQQHLFVILTNSLGAAAQLFGRLPAVSELAEIGREPKLLLLGDALAAKDQHEVLGPGRLDRAHRARGKLPGQIDALDLRAAGGRQRRDLYVEDVLLSRKHRFGGTLSCHRLGSGLRPGLQDWANWGWELPSLGQGPINSQAASAARLSDII